MHQIINTHRKELDELCRLFQVRQLTLFGSAATDEFEPGRSDLDFLVEFQLLNPVRRADAYFGLLLALEDLFQCKVDLVEEGASQNPYFLRAVNQTRALLYAA
ncbi:MAG: nucleotidyltransferase domain-containing protein [Gammaproteobacteria bacterium]|nr:nucleotidyltransferase domain-containing protein [Gammaproteobacteria bacterium]